MLLETIEPPPPVRRRVKFLATHHVRHDQLELLLEDLQNGVEVAERLIEMRKSLSRLVRAVETLGFDKLEQGARAVETLIDWHLRAGDPDHRPVIRAIDRFLDLSLDLCLPEG
jgi:hypothetical protein